MASSLGTYQPFRYRGYVYDVETGLYYLRSRYYNSHWERFINADSILDPQTIHGKNCYLYCESKPIINKDPDGSSIVSCVVIFALCVATALIVSATIIHEKNKQKNKRKNGNSKKSVYFDTKSLTLKELPSTTAKAYFDTLGQELTGNLLEKFNRKVKELRHNFSYFSRPMMKGNTVNAIISYTTGPFYEPHHHIEHVTAEFGYVTHPTAIYIISEVCSFLGEINSPVPYIQLVGDIAQITNFVISISETINGPFPTEYTSYEIVNIEISPGW